MSAKRSIILLIISISCPLVELTEPDVAETLRMALVIFRHGARSPLMSYPADPHRHHPWVVGFGALTTVGTEQGFALGQNLRHHRYGSLVPPHGLYSREEMYIVSSSHERCIMTAQSFLAGFLRPPEGAVRLSIPWQPASVNVLSESEDSIISQTKPCPTYDEALAQSLANPSAELAKWQETLPADFEFVSRHAGMIVNSTTELAYLYDVIDIQSYHGLPQPDWTNEIYPDKTTEFHNNYALMLSATAQLKQLRGGVILTEMMKIMIAKRDGTLDPGRSLYFYSGHDLTLTHLLDSMEMLEQTNGKPAFASAVAIELHENSVLAPDFEVRMVYYDDSNVPDPRYLKIAGCPDPCALEKFELAMQHLYVPDFEEACKIESDAVLPRVSTVLLLILMVIGCFQLP